MLTFNDSKKIDICCHAHHNNAFLRCNIFGLCAREVLNRISVESRFLNGINNTKALKRWNTISKKTTIWLPICIAVMVAINS